MEQLGTAMLWEPKLRAAHKQRRNMSTLRTQEVLADKSYDDFLDELKQFITKRIRLGEYSDEIIDKCESIIFEKYIKYNLFMIPQKNKNV
jgi:flagellar biosynthesis chaperone FliJ